MLRADESLAWMTLARAPAVTTAVLTRALQSLGSAVAILGASDRERELAGFEPKAREFLNSARGPSAAERAWTDQPRHHLIPCTDPRYPVGLRSLEGAPPALYVVGNPEVLNDPQLAIVGSRNPSPAGRETAFEFAESLAACGLCITSGLAEGIDSAAHQGALAAQGTTVAVLGAGVDVIYPACNRDLSTAIAIQGALVSEFPLGEPPRREHFPQRNRLIATLSMGTLVVEAARRSGSLITARLAGEHHRELFAVPGSIRNPLSRGCHELIRQGAKLTETTADILSELNFSAFLGARPPPVSDAVPGRGADPGMDKDHKILLDALGFDPAGPDDLVVRTGFKPEAVSSMMLILELQGHVQAAPGGRYSRVDRSRR
jgi:DNA processing protein